jgi:hypothetical protein
VEKKMEELVKRYSTASTPASLTALAEKQNRTAGEVTPEWTPGLIALAEKQNRTAGEVTPEWTPEWTPERIAKWDKMIIDGARNRHLNNPGKSR